MALRRTHHVLQLLQLRRVRLLRVGRRRRRAKGAQPASAASQRAQHGTKIEPSACGAAAWGASHAHGQLGEQAGALQLLHGLQEGGAEKGA